MANKYTLGLFVVLSLMVFSNLYLYFNRVDPASLNVEEYKSTQSTSKNIALFGLIGSGAGIGLTYMLFKGGETAE